MKNSKNYLIFSLSYSLFINGIIIFFLGSLMPYILKDFKLTYSLAGIILTVQSIGNILGNIFVGFASDRVGRKSMIIFGSICFSAPFIFLFFAKSLFMLYLCFFVIGIGWAAITNLSTSEANNFPDNSASIVNFIHIFSAFGALFGPLFFAFILSITNGNWRYSLIGVFIFSSLLVFFLLFAPFSKPNKKEENISYKKAINFEFLLYIVIIFLYVSTEMNVNGWLAQYMVFKYKFLNISKATLFLSVLWGSIIIGRIICTYALKVGFSGYRLMLILSTGSLISLFLLLISKSMFFSILSIILLGLFFSGIFPSNMSNATVVTKNSNFLNGIIISSGGIGSSIISAIVGKIIDNYGMNYMMAFLTFNMFIVFLASTILFIKYKDNIK
ncbi:sugar MFS transporter [Caldicellulosiruptoraceae bacterium PP1]